MQYDGGYIENYFDGTTPVNLIINNLSGGYNKFNPPYTDLQNQYHPEGHSIIDDGCEVDIQVDWYGNCDMWIDYVRVDDEVADRLFNDPPDQEFEDWINWEADLAEYTEYNDNPLKFYMEEFEFNNVPCMRYVNDKLMQYSGNKYKLMACLKT